MHRPCEASPLPCRAPAAEVRAEVQLKLRSLFKLAAKALVPEVRWLLRQAALVSAAKRIVHGCCCRLCGNALRATLRLWGATCLHHCLCPLTPAVQAPRVAPPDAALLSHMANAQRALDRGVAG